MKFKFRALFLGLFIMAVIESNSQISRADLIAMTPENQQSAFVSLPNNYRLALFVNKLNEIKSSGYFNPTEISFVDGIISDINENIYIQQPSIGTIDNYKNYSINTLGWAEIKWKVVFETLYTPLEFNQRFLIESDPGPESVVPGGTGSQGVCHCRWSLGCPGDMSCNKKLDCSASGGCGWFWSQECEGKCDWAYIPPGGGFKGTGETLVSLKAGLGF
ncbi:MAG: bacteriocin fulvocin C-related protein [Chitinophagales bacterium]|nr:bacteriocin fulvocin C-related protein [Sphingobacteriales bacterium]